MTNKEIEAFNKTFGIETVFYYDDKSICGYEENNIIYLNLNSMNYYTFLKKQKCLIK